MSGPSMRRVSRSNARLIIGELRLLGRALAEEVEIEHLARDGGGGAAAAAAVLDQQRHGELRIVGRGEGDEERVVAVLLADAARVVFLALLQSDHLGGAGLAGDGVARV